MLPLILKKHDGVWVVRDDLFIYGSKARFLDGYFTSIKEKEVVYGGSPRWGFAQISIAFLAKRHNKRATIIIAKGKLTEYSKRAASLGAVIEQIPMGFLSVCQSVARTYAEQQHAHLLPFGLSVPEALVGCKRWATTLDIEPDEVWTVAGSGTLSRGLQQAWPRAEFFAVQTGKHLIQKDAGRARIIEHPLPFSKPAKALPPFPSVPEYDAKAWEYIPKDGKKVRLFWNVGA